MDFTRREFLKYSGVAGAAAAACGTGLGLFPVGSHAAGLKMLGDKQTTSICPYCAVGCGLICHSDKNGNLLGIEGDPEHPVNEGALCAKGAGLYEMTVNPSRQTKPLYRAPGASDWQEISWDQALSRIAQKVKASRDASFEKTNSAGQRVNRTLGIAHVGSAALDNEECWLLQAIMRSLGLVYIEHQARI